VRRSPVEGAAASDEDAAIGMSEHLTALDATFLELEQADASAHMHIGAVMIFDPQPERRTPPVERIRNEIEARLSDLPRFRQRLSAPRTGGLRWPSWEIDERFEIAKHVLPGQLPAPRGETELLAWASDYFSRRLDRSRPLWELVVCELADGRWAMVTKTHHCMVDGVGSVDIGQTILDAEPAAAPRAKARPERHASTESAEPAAEADHAAPVNGVLDLAKDVGSAGVSLARAGLRAARGALRLGVDSAVHPDHAREALSRARATAELIYRDEVIAAPRTSLNRPIGTDRRLAVIQVPLGELKTVKQGLGGTVNDVVLAASAGGLRRLLLDREEPLPLEGLRAMVPVNIRAAGDRVAVGNRISSLFVRLPMIESDAETRYTRQMEEAEALKSGTQAVGSSTLLDVTGLAPPVLHSLLARSLYATRLFNVTVTNVPGPQRPLYAFGSRMRKVWPLVPLAAEHALGIAVFSYDGNVFFCLNADRESVPDLDVIAAGIEQSLHELLDVARERDASLASQR
jgi:diacylglycerol O-acyltransferase / wax synthase